jgi:hypothetical protein
VKNPITAINNAPISEAHDPEEPIMVYPYLHTIRDIDTHHIRSHYFHWQAIKEERTDSLTNVTNNEE